MRHFHDEIGPVELRRSNPRFGFITSTPKPGWSSTDVAGPFASALGIPVGFLLNRLLVWLVKEVVNVDVPASFPPVNVVLALVGTVLLALLVMALPLRRVVRLRPGEALRYA